MNSIATSTLATTNKRTLVDQCLDRIQDKKGEGARVFTRVYADATRLAATTADEMKKLGLDLPPLAGLPVSIKDLFDVKGEATLAGSRVLTNAAPAARDAAIVRRLRQAGAAIIGKTNMTEFAFSGLGINPHYGTPLNPWKRDEARIPGGSSSGAAISITDGMAVAAIGTDTGGSCRIPAAFTGIAGYKPSAQTVPMEGTLPLSSSFDSVGPLAADVEMCARTYAVLSGAGEIDLGATDPGTLTFGVIQNHVLDQMDQAVGGAYEKALQRLAKAGVRLREFTLPVIDELPSIFGNGGLVAAESFAWHRELLATRGGEYDPRVSVRLQRGSLSSAADYVALLLRRRQLIQKWQEQVANFDAVVLPTVPIMAPTLKELAEDEPYGRINLLALRNPTVINAFDGCAISLPCHEAGQAPAGLMLACVNGSDHRLLGMAKALETVLQPHRA